MGTDIAPFDLECVLINAAGYLSNHEDTPTFLRSGNTLTGAQMVAYHTPQHTVHSLRESPITLCHFPDILLYAMAGYLGIDIVTLGPPYRQPSNYACRAHLPTGASRWVVRLRSGVYVAAIPAPPVLETVVDPLRMQEEAPSAPDVPEHQTQDGLYPTGLHTLDEWGEITYGDAMHT